MHMLRDDPLSQTSLPDSPYSLGHFHSLGHHRSISHQCSLRRSDTLCLLHKPHGLDDVGRLRGCNLLHCDRTRPSRHTIQRRVPDAS